MEKYLEWNERESKWIMRDRQRFWKARGEREKRVRGKERQR